MLGIVAYTFNTSTLQGKARVSEFKSNLVLKSKFQATQRNPVSAGKKKGRKRGREERRGSKGGRKREKKVKHLFPLTELEYLSWVFRQSVVSSPGTVFF